MRGYFEASLSPKEERRLKAFLASTDDPDFEEVKAVAGYFSAGKAYNAVNRSGRQAQMRAFAIAASLTAIVFASVLTLSLVNKNRAKDIAAMLNDPDNIFLFVSDDPAVTEWIVNLCGDHRSRRVLLVVKSESAFDRFAVHERRVTVQNNDVSRIFAQKIPAHHNGMTRSASFRLICSVKPYSRFISILADILLDEIFSEARENADVFYPCADHRVDDPSQHRFGKNL